MASASASVSACSSSSVSRAADRGGDRARTVAGSSRSRRVAVSGSSRWWRTSAARTVDVRSGRSRARAATSRGHDRAGRGVVAGPALADVVQQRADQQQVGAGDARVSAAARAAVSTRCRSTVKRCTGLRCGRLRTRSQSGSSRTISPAWSSASQTPMAARPGAEQGHERVAGLGGPRLGQRRACPASRRTVARGERQARPARRRRRRAATSAGSRRDVGAAGEHDLAVLLDDAVGERARRSGAGRRAPQRRPTRGPTRVPQVPGRSRR